jgi:putative hemolysin
VNDLGLILLLLLGSAFFSGTELAVTMASRVRLRTAAVEGRRLARRADRLLRRRDHTIAVCLVGNNLVNVALAVYGREALLRVPFLSVAMADALATLLAVTLVLLFGEIIPKAVAQNYPNRVLRVAVLPLQAVRLLLAPLLLLAAGFTWLARRVVGARGSVLEFASREELKQFVARSQSRGHVDPEERVLIDHIVEFWKLDPRTFVRPLHAVPRVTQEATAGEAKERMRQLGLTRLSVTDRMDLDVVGVVTAAGMLGADNGAPVTQWMSPPLRAELGAGFDRLLAQLQGSPGQTAVVDRGAGAVGVIRLDDVLHSLLGLAQESATGGFALAQADPENPEKMP